MLRDALRDTHHQRDFRLNCLLDTLGGNWRRHKDCARIRPCRLHGIGYGCKDRFPKVVGAGFLGVRPANDIGPVFDRLLRVKRTLAAGEALEDDFGLGGEAEVLVGAGVTGP